MPSAPKPDLACQSPLLFIGSTTLFLDITG